MDKPYLDPYHDRLLFLVALLLALLVCAVIGATRGAPAPLPRNLQPLQVKAGLYDLWWGTTSTVHPSEYLLLLKEDGTCWTCQRPGSNTEGWAGKWRWSKENRKLSMEDRVVNRCGWGEAVYAWVAKLDDSLVDRDATGFYGAVPCRLAPAGTIRPLVLPALAEGGQ